MYSKIGFARAASLALCCSLGIALSGGTVWAQQATSTTSTAKSQRSADRALARDVRKALVREQGLDIDDVRIIAKQGAIGLEGTVPDGGQIQKVSTIAASVPGVKSVRSYLTVREEGS